MLALAALVIFIVAAVLAFLKIWTVLGVIGLICVGLACLAAYNGLGLGPVAWRRGP